MTILGYYPNCASCKFWERYENPELFAPPNSGVDLSKLGKCSCKAVNMRLSQFPPGSSIPGLYISRLPIVGAGIIINTEETFVCFDYQKRNDV